MRPEVDAGEVLATPGRWRGHDKMQEGAADMGVWSPSSIASRCQRERRLEMSTATASFGLRWGGRLAANWVMPEGSEDARDPITRWSTKRGRRYPLLSPESSGYARSYVGLRREILSD
jgi:hypothetical protein